MLNAQTENTKQRTPRTKQEDNYAPHGTPLADDADMREVSHFLLELKNGSESRGDVVCKIPHSAPGNEVGAGSDLDPPPSATPISLDPLQSASPETKVGIVRITDMCSILFPPPRISAMNSNHFWCSQRALDSSRAFLTSPQYRHFGTVSSAKHSRLSIIPHI